jgi:hypothetical protein
MSKRNITFTIQLGGFALLAWGAYSAFKEPQVFWPLVGGGGLWFVGWFLRKSLGWN